MHEKGFIASGPDERAYQFFKNGVEQPTCYHVLDEVSVSGGINYGDVIF